MSKTVKHVLLLPSWYLPEGGQFCRNQAQALCEMGIKANVLANVTLSWKKYKKQIFKFPWFSYTSNEDNIIVYRFFHRTIPFIKKMNGLLWSWQTVRLFIKYKKKHGTPDLIHVHSVLWGGYAAYLIQKKFNIPYVITEHKGIFGLSCQYSINQFQEWQTPFMEKAFSNSKAIIPVSTKLIPKIETYLNRNILTQTISNLVDTDFFYYKKRPKKETINFVAVNGFRYVKGYDILFPAFDKVCAEISNINLRIVGEDFEGEEFEKLWSQIKHKDKISFAGEIDKFGVREELWKADIFVISSRVESQSVSTLEAMSTGLPVICTTVIPEYMANENTAIIVPVENIEALTSAIIEMYEKLQQFDGTKISEHIAKIASKEVVVGKIIDLYKNIYNSKN